MRIYFVVAAAAALAIGTARPAAAVPVTLDLEFTPTAGLAPTGSITYESGDAVASGSAALTDLLISDPNTGSVLDLTDDITTADVNFDAGANPVSVTILADDEDTGATFDLTSLLAYTISGEFGGGTGNYALVPEPGTLLLLGGGLVLLARRRS